jgi:DNA-directed RNA polymerase specialized sigma24 family protein
MSAADSITAWIEDLKLGDHEAVQQLWNRYYSRLVHLARQRLVGERCRTELAEDAALSAFASFCRAAEKGRFPQLDDRLSLWRLLLRIAVVKALGVRRKSHAIRRGAGRVRGESAFISGTTADDMPGIARVVGDEPTPELAATMAEEFERLLVKLGSSELRAVAVAKMEGYTNDEISVQLNCAKRTVERRLNLIRQKWQDDSIQEEHTRRNE